jgi:hypothetical protein
MSVVERKSFAIALCDLVLSILLNESEGWICHSTGEHATITHSNVFPTFSPTPTTPIMARMALGYRNPRLKLPIPSCHSVENGVQPLERKLKRHVIPNTMTTNLLVTPASRHPETHPANHYPYNDLLHRPPESQLRDSIHRRTSQLKPPYPLHIGIRLHIAKSTTALQRTLLHLHERERERERDCTSLLLIGALLKCRKARRSKLHFWEGLRRRRQPRAGMQKAMQAGLERPWWPWPPSPQPSP